MRFLFDEMLKKLSGWCRILGIHSEYFTDKSDDELLEYAKENNLVFVTRDKALSKRCTKHGVEVVFIKSNDIKDQIEDVLKTGAEITFPEKTRCSSCNEILEPVSKDGIKDRLPPKVDSEKYWICRSCGKVFWEGGHWKNIRRMLAELSKPI